eukprot:PRCOL_00004522-RA
MAAVASCIANKAVASKAVAVKVSANKAGAMQTWAPRKEFETFSYLPPLSDGEIARQVEYCVASGWTPCIEFDWGARAEMHRDSNFIKTPQPCYQDGRYWMMWKLPMYGCTNPNQVLEEVRQCKSEYPHAYVRVIGFDSVRQVQCLSFIVQKPAQY